MQTNTIYPRPQSYLDVNANSSIACFRGTLDYETLGGAGFASQRTVTEEFVWDLSEYDGIELVIERADCMLPKSPSFLAPPRHMVTCHPTWYQIRSASFDSTDINIPLSIYLVYC